MESSINIRHIIKNKYIKMKYQPIISPKNSKLIGFEALVRGIDNNSQELSPYILFEEAKKAYVVDKLDLLCIEEAIKGFLPLFTLHPTIFLFINIDVTVIDQYISDDNILYFAQLYHIPTNQIILEINELPSGSLEPIKQFTQKYRQLGFHISLDDIGAGSSNLDRIPTIKPDIIKIDMQLIFDIHKSFYKQQVVTMLIRLAASLGAMVVAEGSENIKDIMFVLEKGAQFLQGFYISKPEALNENLYEHSQIKMKTISQLQKKHIAKLNHDRIQMTQLINEIGMKIINTLATYSTSDFESILKDILSLYDKIESAYVVNENGYLITNTIFGNSVNHSNIMNLYIPASIHESVQLEAYYYNLTLNTQVQYVSEPYISRATGTTCVTMSSFFYDKDMSRHILCLDFVF